MANFKRMLELKKNKELLSNPQHIWLIIDNRLVPCTVNDIEVNENTLTSGVQFHGLSVLLSYPVEGGEKYISITHNCTAPPGCKLDWISVLYAWEIKNLGV